MTAPSPLPDDPEPRSSVEVAQWLSALADGDKDALPHAQARWRDDAGARERWHTYHLIGDVMRSEDLASPPGRDAAFLAALRTRLADEPVPLAPAPLDHAAAMPTRRLGWRAPLAVAAGFVAVAATLVLLRPEGFKAGVGGPVLSENATGASGRLVVTGQEVIRDPQLDAYLDAHRRAGAAALPGLLIRPVDLVTPPVPISGVPMPRPAPSGSAPQPVSVTR